MAIALESGIGMIEVGVYTAQHYPIAAHRIVFMSSISPDKPATSAQSAPISLPRVRALFSRPGRVAESQFLRREISVRMFERLSLIKTDPLAVLDAGCGEGDDLALLHQSFPRSLLLGLDAASAMLATARSQALAALPFWQRMAAKLSAPPGPGGAALACADFARLPLAPASFDLVWSNLALHWHPQPDKVFAEWRRVLRVDGLLMFSCFGPDSFQQLRAAFAAAGEHHAVLPFVDLHDFGDMLVDAGFATPVMDMEKLTISYSSAEKLLADVQAFGGNPLLTRRSSLIGRSRWQRIVQALEAQRDADGKLNLTIEVIYGHAFRPVLRKTASGEAIVRFDLPRR